MSTDPGSAAPFPEQQFSPEQYSAAEPPREGHGCFFYGCIIAIVLAVLALIALGVGGYLTYRAYLKFVDQYTSATPMTLPKVEMPEEERKALQERFDVFKKAIDEGQDAEPLVLTGDELNVLLANASGVKDRVYFIVEGDKLKGEVSLPLDALGLPGVQGRYFNGKATFLASLKGGQLVVNVDSAELNGQPLSEQIMTGLRTTNLAQDAARQPENAAFLNKLESIEIKDGKITVKARPKENRSSEEPKKEEPKKEESTGAEPAKPADTPQPAEKAKAEAPPG
jgi:hypothetical protein